MAECRAVLLNPLRLVREGTSQDQRQRTAISPDSAPADGKTIANDVVFAAAFSRYLNHFDSSNKASETADWSSYFGADPIVGLATAAIDKGEDLKRALARWQRALDTIANKDNEQLLRNSLGSIFSTVATLALAIDRFYLALPAGETFRLQLKTLVGSQLSPALVRLIGYYKAGRAANLLADLTPSPDIRVFDQDGFAFSQLLPESPGAISLSAVWSNPKNWSDFVTSVVPDSSIFGPAGTVFKQVNHCAKHTIFSSILDQFLRVRAQIESEAQAALSAAFEQPVAHAPHYGLFLAVLQLFDLVRQQGNQITQRHLDFYYRRVLGLTEKQSVPARVHLLGELGKQVSAFKLDPGTLFKAGKDANGKDAVFKATAETVLNRARVAELRTLYRHEKEEVSRTKVHEGRLFASPVANSGDGLGGPFAGTDKSWHPFFNKNYVGGALSQINMPEATVGFAIASHHLLLAEGDRTITIVFQVSANPPPGSFAKEDIRCLLSTEAGWLEKTATSFQLKTNSNSSSEILLELRLDGADPAVRPASRALHGPALGVGLPVLQVQIRHDAGKPFAYDALKSLSIQSFHMEISVKGLKSLAVSNDFGPVDISKPFLPWGADPRAKSSLTIGCKEAFQKPLAKFEVHVDWQVPPPQNQPKVAYAFLKAGMWEGYTTVIAADSNMFSVSEQIAQTVLNQPDFGPDELYSTSSRNGFFRLQLNGDVGQAAHRQALQVFLSARPPTGTPPTPPPIPTAAALTASYRASASTSLNSTERHLFESRKARFFHVTPFGAAEQHPVLLGGADIKLLPSFVTERDGSLLENSAEFYIGLSGLVPPQDVTLLFQVADGTANPLALKPTPHISWSYLSQNRWRSFAATAVQDGTKDGLVSGIVRLSIPATASADNSLMPEGLYWLRLAVTEKPDAVCRIIAVATQAVEAVFENNGNAPDFAANPLLPPGTISKLVKPVSAVKTISQPFSTFGGRSKEAPMAFYTRVSERLRHKDRAISLWDYEHLVLAAFPEIYKIKCLNHTRFEPDESGTGLYDELAAGHVTVVTIPRVDPASLRDPLKPYTSLGLLQDIKTFLTKRSSCFAHLHVCNPQFEEVRLSLSVKLHTGFDTTFYTLELQKAITRFLSPWAFGEGNPSFNGKIHKAVLINFIEDHPAVDYVSDVRMYRDVGGANGSEDFDTVEGSRAVSILVSAASHRHKITIINAETQLRAVEQCGCSP